MNSFRISHSQHYVNECRKALVRNFCHTVLAGFIGTFFGLLMGMTVLAVFLGGQAAFEAGEPGMLLIKVLVLGTFVILSVILFTCGFGGVDKD